MALFEAGEKEQALDQFQRSRALVPSAQNILNAAVCLHHLGRLDEALELYEEVVTRFPDTEAQARASIDQLKGKVGLVVLRGGDGGSIVIDGKARGTLPRKPIPVMAGSHAIRVMRVGTRSFETTVDVAPGGVQERAVTLVPIVHVGRLRIESNAGEGSAVFVDRALVGTTPWEGSLSPGAHVIWTTHGEMGSRPRAAIVDEGQTALVRLQEEPLGPEVAIEVAPMTAELVVDGVRMGAGSWRGRLARGRHAIELREHGYHPYSQKVDLDAVPVKVDARLSPDERSDRWPRPADAREPARFFVGLNLGYAFTAPYNDPFVDGVRAGERGPVTLGRFEVAFRGFSAALALGYRRLQYRDLIGRDVSSQEVLMGAGGAYRLALGRFGARARFEFLTGPASNHPFGARTFVLLCVHYGLGLDVQLGRFRVGPSLSALSYLTLVNRTTWVPQLGVEYDL